MYYAAACQTDFPAPLSREEIGARTERMCRIVEQTVVGYEPFFDVRLLAFPEFSHAVPIHESTDKLLKHLAIPVPTSTRRPMKRSRASWAATFRPALSL